LPYPFQPKKKKKNNTPLLSQLWSADFWIRSHCTLATMRSSQLARAPARHRAGGGGGSSGGADMLTVASRGVLHGVDVVTGDSRGPAIDLLRGSSSKGEGGSVIPSADSRVVVAAGEGGRLLWEARVGTAAGPLAVLSVLIGGGVPPRQEDYDVPAAAWRLTPPPPTPPPPRAAAAARTMALSGLGGAVAVAGTPVRGGAGQDSRDPAGERGDGVAVQPGAVGGMLQLPCMLAAPSRRLYVLSEDKVDCVDAATGEMKWRRKVRHESASLGALSVGNGETNRSLPLDIVRRSLLWIEHFSVR
ncbi:hypothetical protein DFJ73DRAFT_923796, partial [Zopfochytrium polystomum]